MSKRVCPVVNCPEFMPCQKHKRTTSQRGYGVSHRREREQWAPVVAQGETPCRRCRELIQAGEPWDLGHPDAACDAPKAPEHRRCNRATATHGSGS